MAQDNAAQSEADGIHPHRVLGAARGTEEEFSAFFATEYGHVVRTVYLIVRDHGHAEEVAQEAFLRLLDHWSKVVRYDHPAAWVRRVAIRIATRAINRERKRTLLERRSRPFDTPPSDPVVENDELLAAVRALPANQRVAVVLFYFEDRPVSEVADLIGCAPATARVHLHKARQRLALLLRTEVNDVVG